MSARIKDGVTVMKNVYIIGGGPAGVSAALYAKRGGLETHLIYMKKSSLGMAHQIDNYYGAPGVTGQELYERGLKQAADLGVDMIEEEVLGISFEEKFTITTAENRYECDYLILATGAFRNRPAIKGIREFEGKGVSYCAVCDGFFYRKKKVAVLGNATYAAHEAEYLSRIAEKVYVLTNGKAPEDEALKNYEVIEKKIASIEGEVKIAKAVFEDGEELALDGMFVALGSAGSVELARKMGILVDASNKIVVNENRETNIPGVYAAGDAVDGIMQVNKAVYDGMLAAQDIIRKQKGS